LAHAPLEGRVLGDDQAAAGWPSALIGIVAGALDAVLGERQQHAAAALRVLGDLAACGLIVDIKLTNEWGLKVARNIEERKAAQRDLLRAEEVARRLERTCREHETIYATTGRKLAYAEHECSQLATQNDELASVVTAQVKEIERLRLLARIMTEARDDLARQMDDAQRIFDIDTRTVEDAETEIERLRRELADTRAILDGAGTEVNRMRAELNGPTVTRQADGHLTVEWPTGQDFPTGAQRCLMSRPLFDQITDELNALRAEVAASRAILDGAGAEVNRLRGLVAEVLACFDAMTDAGATGWIDPAADARIRREAGQP
jgi:hypothetical protein